MKDANGKPPIEDPNTDIKLVYEAIEALDGPLRHQCDLDANGVATHLAVMSTGVLSDAAPSADEAVRSLGRKVSARAHGGNGKG